MARKALYEYEHNVTMEAGQLAGRLRFNCINGTEITINVTDLPPEVIAEALAHGLKQKTIDAAAIPCDPETGRSASPDDKIAAMREVAERLPRQWNATREGGGATGGLLLRALAELYPEKSRETLEAFLAKRTDKEKAALRADPRIADIIVRIKAASAKVTTVDTAALMDELA